MKYIIYRRFINRTAHVWFATEISSKINSDKTIFYAMKNPNLTAGKYPLEIIPQNTLITDLTLSIETLFKTMTKTLRYEIRKIETDKTEITTHYYKGKNIPQYLLSDFQKSYNNMYKSKNIKMKLDKSFVKKYCLADMATLSVAFYKGNPYVFHFYINDAQRARLLYSCSNFRNNTDIAGLIGMMNKTLHWKDILYFKNERLSEYDWGGINSFSKPNSIDKFKMFFGGQKAIRYNYIIINTIIAKFSSFIRKSIYAMAILYKSAFIKNKA